MKKRNYIVISLLALQPLLFLANPPTLESTDTSQRNPKQFPELPTIPAAKEVTVTKPLTHKTLDIISQHKTYAFMAVTSIVVIALSVWTGHYFIFTQSSSSKPDDTDDISHDPSQPSSPPPTTDEQNTSQPSVQTSIEITDDKPQPLSMADICKRVKEKNAQSKRKNQRNNRNQAYKQLKTQE